MLPSHAGRQPQRSAGGSSRSRTGVANSLRCIHVICPPSSICRPIARGRAATPCLLGITRRARAASNALMRSSSSSASCGGDRCLLGNHEEWMFGRSGITVGIVAARHEGFDTIRVSPSGRGGLRRRSAPPWPLWSTLPCRMNAFFLACPEHVRFSRVFASITHRQV